MAAVNEASIRVTANSAPFQQDMRKNVGFVRQSARKMGDALGDELTEGFADGKQAAKDMVSSIRDVASQVLTLGGAFTSGAMVLNSVRAQKANVGLANSLSAVQGRTVSVAEAQRQVERAAMAASTSLEDMRTNAMNMVAVSDKVDLAEALERAEKQAVRFGLEGEQMAEVWARVIGGGFADNLDDAESMIEKLGVTTMKTGVRMEDAFNPEDMLEFLSKTKKGNMEFEQGLVLLEQMKGKVRDLGEALEFPEELGEVLGGTKGLKDVRDAAKLTEKQLGKNFTVAENFITVMKKGPKAFAALQAGLGEKATAGLEAMLGTDIIEAAGKRKLKKDELEEAIGKITSVFNRQAEVQFDAVSAAERNAQGAETAAAKFQRSLNKLEMTFQSEKVTNAIDTLADRLPEIVDPIADVVTMIVDNPWKTLAAVVGGKLALAFAGPLITGAITKGLGALFVQMATVQAATAATAVTGAASAGGATTALGLSGAAGVGVAGTTAAGAAATAATIGAAALAAGAVGAGVGTAISKGFVEGEEEAEAMSIRQASSAVSMAENLGGPGADFLQVDAAIERLIAAKAEMEEASFSPLGGGFAGVVSMATGASSPAEMREDTISKADDQIKRLTEVLTRLGDASQRAGDKMFNAGGAGGLSRGVPHTEQVWGPDSIGG